MNGGEWMMCCVYCEWNTNKHIIQTSMCSPTKEEVSDQALHYKDEQLLYLHSWMIQTRRWWSLITLMMMMMHSILLYHLLQQPLLHVDTVSRNSLMVQRQLLLLQRLLLLLYVLQSHQWSNEHRATISSLFRLTFFQLFFVWTIQMHLFRIRTEKMKRKKIFHKI